MKFRRSRLGNAGEPSHHVPQQVIALVNQTPSTPGDDTIIAVGHRGYSPAQISEFRDEQILSSPIILNNIDKIHREFIRGKGKSTLKTYRKNLRLVVRFTDMATSATGRVITSASDFDATILRLLVTFCGKDGGTYRRLSIFRRFLRAIGVDPALIPLNSEKAPKSQEKLSISPGLLKKIINHFKYEMHLIIARYDECQSLLQDSTDPRKRKGIRKGDWESPASRMWAIVNLIGLDIKNVLEARKHGLRTAMSIFEERPGAVRLFVDNVHRRVGGVEGHLAWFYPSQRDLLPFLMLLLIRTRAGYAVVAGLAHGQYHFRHLAIEWNSRPNTVVQLAVQKHRTKPHLEKDPEIYRCLTLIRPVSYAYQLIKFLEKLSQPLRDEIARQIDVLRCQQKVSAEQATTLARLDRIKDDLFVYAAEGTIYSLSEYDGVPTSLRESLELLKFPTNTKSIRSTELASGVKLFGDDAVMARILGDHKGPKTFKHYIRERELRERSEAQFIDIFEKSVALIEAEIYSKKNVKNILSEQGVPAEQITTLMTAGIVTHWGNHCSDPFFPPEPFGTGTPPGKLCVAQECIEGCPRARWFPSASLLLRLKIEELKEKLENSNFHAGANSLTYEWIERCERLLNVIDQVQNR